MASQNRVIGSGKIYFDKFDANGLKTGERYIGNTPSLTVTRSYQNLDHYDSDNGERVKDDTAQLQSDTAVSFSCDNIDMPNVALMFGSSDPVDETVTLQTGISENLVGVHKDRYYQLGSAISPDGVGSVSNVVVNDSSGIAAYGYVAFAANPSAADTLTINGHAITFVSGTPTTHQVQIGANTALTAQRLKTEINAFQSLYGVSASGFANAIDLQALVAGTGGNSLTLAKSGTNPTLSGATLSGGASGGVISTSNYTVDLVHGRLYVTADAPNVTNGDTLQITYDVALQTRTVVIDALNQVEGALRFISNNFKGSNKNWYWPHTKLTPSGDFALKAENAWQSMTFGGEVLTPTDGSNRTYVRAA